MQIKNLSSAQTFGTVIASLPDDMPCTSHCCVRAGEPIKEWLSQEPVVLDYVSGMPLLVIYEAESYSLYYLDRVFKLRPGVRFSVTALDALCCFDICTARPDVLSLLGEHPAEIFYGASSDLKLERLYTFFYQECSRDFYFRGEQHEALELVYVDRGELHNLVGGVDILLRPQQMLLINRNIWHMQYADLPVSFLTVSFRAAVDSPCSSLCGQVLALTARQITLLRRMLDEHSSTDFAYDCVESLLKLLLADLIRCANDEAESVALIDEIYRLAGIYRTCIAAVVHFVPNGLKLRGHLGSELQRKSAAILSIEKDENPEVSVVKALKVRDGSPLDIPLMQFRWDKQAGMPVYVGEKPRAEKEKRKEKELAEMAREAFARQEKYGYIELCELIQEMLEVKERTAKGYIRYMREKEIIEKEGDCYVHGQGRV